MFDYRALLCGFHGNPNTASLSVSLVFYFVRVCYRLMFLLHCASFLLCIHVTTNVLFSSSYSQRFRAPTLLLTLPPSLLPLLPCALTAKISPKDVRRKKKLLWSYSFLRSLKKEASPFLYFFCGSVCPGSVSRSMYVCL